MVTILLCVVVLVLIFMSVDTSVREERLQIERLCESTEPYDLDWLVKSAREGDVLFKVDTYVSSIFCGHYVSHVVLVLQQEDVSYVVDCRPDKFGGVKHIKIKTLQSFLFKGKHFYLRQLSGKKIDHEKIWESAVRVVQAEKQAYDMQVVTMQLNRALDYSFLPALPLNKKGEGSTICSHLCYQILHECGVVQKAIISSFVHPVDMLVANKEFNFEENVLLPYKYSCPIYVSKKCK